MGELPVEEMKLPVRVMVWPPAVEPVFGVMEVMERAVVVGGLMRLMIVD